MYHPSLNHFTWQIFSPHFVYFTCYCFDIANMTRLILVREEQETQKPYESRKNSKESRTSCKESGSCKSCQIPRSSWTRTNESSTQRQVFEFFSYSYSFCFRIICFGVFTAVAKKFKADCRQRKQTWYTQPQAKIRKIPIPAPRPIAPSLPTIWSSSLSYSIWTRKTREFRHGVPSCWCRRRCAYGRFRLHCPELWDEVEFGSKFCSVSFGQFLW